MTPDLLAEAATVLRRGGVIVHATETVYGLACDPFDAAAVARVRAIKGRDADKPMLAVTDRWDRVAAWLASVPEPLARLTARLTEAGPMAVTLVLPASAAAPPSLVSAAGEVAVRCSADETVAALVTASARALLSTSANQAGEPPAARFADLDREVIAAVDLALDAGRDLGGVPSTVVAVRDGRIVVLRAGAVPEAEVQRLAS